MPRSVKEIVLGYGDVPDPPKHDMPGVGISGLRVMILDCDEKSEELDLENPEHLGPKLRIQRYKTRLMEILHDRYQAEKARLETEDVGQKPVIVLPPAPQPDPQPVGVAERSIA